MALKMMTAVKELTPTQIIRLRRLYLMTPTQVLNLGRQSDPQTRWEPLRVVPPRKPPPSIFFSQTPDIIIITNDNNNKDEVGAGAST